MILADAYDAFLIDLDGVVWRGESPLPGADEAVAALRERGKRVVFVTNNSSRTPREVAAKLMRMKIPTQNADVVTSAHVVLAHLRTLGLDAGDRVYVCGAEGLMRIIAGERFVPTDEPHDVRAVVVGWNPKLTFEDIRRTAGLVRTGLPFVASNDDATYPAEGDLLPGTGAILAAIETAAGRKATVVGKPRPDLFRLALDRAGVPAERAMVVGDRPETDIAGARAAGLPSALVLSGVVGESGLGGAAALPDAILDGLGDLLRDLPQPSVEERNGTLVAKDGQELATLAVERDGERVVVREVRVPAHVDARTGWRAVRCLLLHAVAGAAEVEASADVRPFLERIGVAATGDGQPRLFTS